MLHVIGGTYFESCAEPDRHDFYGSGLRAAAAVSALTKVMLHTYVDPRSLPNLVANATSFNVRLDTHASARTITFSYSHPLATPIITPPLHSVRPERPIELNADAVLCFGMLEGGAKVTARRAVYDPQSPFDPLPFDHSGSTADELAIVANAREAAALAGVANNSIDDVAARLRSKTGAAVIVIKRGAHGAAVYTARGKSVVPAYETDRIWKIGSGDVFAAAFAFYWAVERVKPNLAAERASAAAASYCGTHALPLPRDFHDRVVKACQPIRLPARRSKPKVYLAGPFFTMAQRWLINEARQALAQQGVRVFSPLHDVGHGSADDVVPADLDALRTSAAVLAIVDGIDAGTLFEVGYATARGTPVVAFAQNEHAEALKMLEGSDCRICDDFTSAVYHTVWAALST